jgi:hypothetical protein
MFDDGESVEAAGEAAAYGNQIKLNRVFAYFLFAFD